MAAYRRGQSPRTYRGYEDRDWQIEIEGNTARRLAEPELYPPVRHDAEEVRRARRNREKAMQMSPAFVFFLSMVSFMVLGSCVGYLKVQASINTRIDNVEKLEQELAGLTDINEATRSRIAVASDIKQIYKTATEKLGMVYPDDSQVIYYDRTESEYVQQNENIPR